MKEFRRVFLTAFLVLLLLGTGVYLFCSHQEGFNGSCVKNADAYLLDIQRMTGTDLHTLELQAGDTLRIHFETEKGQLYMELKAPDGTTLYSGNGKQITEYMVNIPQSGVYPVIVEARQAKGSIHIQLKEKSS